MKYNPTLLTIFTLGLMLVCIGLGVGGCADTPRARYAQIQDVYITTTQTLLAARQRGDIDAETWEDDILPLLREGDAALDQYDEATKSGADPTASAEFALGILDRLRVLAVKYAERH
jgi:hypothetical protein